jgi:hypothetical protein
MSLPHFIGIDRRRYLWRDLVTPPTLRINPAPYRKPYLNRITPYAIPLGPPWETPGQHLSGLASH